MFFLKKSFCSFQKKKEVVDNTDAENRLVNDALFVCVLQIMNNIYTVQIFYDFQKERKLFQLILFSFLQKSPTIVVPH